MRINILRTELKERKVLNKLLIKYSSFDELLANQFEIKQLKIELKRLKNG